VLFLCSKNSARSQMAAALLRQRAGDRFTIHSAGLRPEPVHPLTLQVLDELGLDTKACQPRDLGEFIGRVPIHFAIVVCDRANQDCAQMFPFAQKRLYWPFEDPAAFDGTAAARLERFRAVRDAIDVRIRDFVDDLPRSNERAG
jgi:arsenate reductase